MTESVRTTTRLRDRRLVALVAAGILAAIAATLLTNSGPSGADASSHREAPLIAGDPRADNTDVYAFVSPDAPDTVTLIANWIPFEEPNGGPNFYAWADDTRYNIKIDNDGDALPDLTYTWVFDTVVRNGADHFLYNTGPVSSLDDPDLNVYQTYDLTVTDGAGNVTVLLGNGDGVTSPGDPVAAPSLVGPGSVPDYAPLVTQATRSLPGGGQTYVGQADDPFFLDLRVFDLLYGGDASELGDDTLAGYNVNTIALQVPRNTLAINGDAANNPVIGIWSTTDRRSASVAGDMAADSDFVQVSRLGNPLVNEVVVPLNLKDAFNSISPDVDASVAPVVAKVLDPILPGLIEAIYGVPAPPANRNDLFEIFLTGICRACAGVDGDPAQVLDVDLNSQLLNADDESARGVGVPFRPSEMLRLNMSVPPAADPQPYGVLAGDVAGFPNGRRLTDDVIDIAVQAVEGAAQSGQLVEGLLAIDSVDRNDRDFRASFPYLALPHTASVNTGPEQSPRAPEYISVNPERLLDTRNATRPAANSVIELDVTGIGTSLVPDDAGAVYVNVTTTNATDGGFITVYACGADRPVASNVNQAVGRTTTNLVATQIGTGGKICLYTSSSTDVIVDVQGYHPSTAAYTALRPARILETRTTEPGGQVGYTGAQPAAGQTVVLDVTSVGTSPIPDDAEAAYLNVTTVGGTGQGFVTVFPCGATRPTASNINLAPGVIRSNLIVAPIAANGTVCLYTSAATHLVADVQGYAPSETSYVAVSPERLLDTRAGAEQRGYTGAKPIAGQTIELDVTGVGTARVPNTAGTVMLTLTSTDSVAGHITVYPCGAPRPLASNLNLNEFDTANMVAAAVGDGGRVCIFTSAPTHIVADLAGYFPDSVLVPVG